MVQIYLEIPDDELAYLLNYVQIHEMKNYSGQLLSKEQACVSIVRSWIAEQLGTYFDHEKEFNSEEYGTVNKSRLKEV